MQDGIMTTSWPFSQILYDFFNASALTSDASLYILIL